MASCTIHLIIAAAPSSPQLTAALGLRASSLAESSSFAFGCAARFVPISFSRRAIGADHAMLLGSLIVMQEKLAAWSQRHSGIRTVPHLLFAEEAQNFIGDFESILAEIGKFNLVVAVA